MYKVLRVRKTNDYDLFQGDGWEEWTRVRFKNGALEYIGGSVLSTYQLRKLTQFVIKHKDVINHKLVNAALRRSK